VEILILGHWRNTLEDASSKTMRKWNWLIADGSECKSPTSNTMEVLAIVKMRQMH
jgi:hypothetical protein